MAEVDYSLIAMTRDVSSIIQLSGYVSRHGGSKYRRSDLVEVGEELKLLKDAITSQLEEYFRRMRDKDVEESRPDIALIRLLDNGRDILERLARRVSEIDQEIQEADSSPRGEVTGGSLEECLAQVTSLLRDATTGLLRAVEQARRGPPPSVRFV